MHPQGVLLSPFLPASSTVRTQGPRGYITKLNGFTDFLTVSDSLGLQIHIHCSGARVFVILVIDGGTIIVHRRCFCCISEQQGFSKVSRFMSETDIFASSTCIVTLDRLKISPFVGNTRHSDDEIDFAGSEGFESSKVDNMSPRWLSLSMRWQSAVRFRWHSPKSEVSKSKQAPMPFMQQGIWILHSASSRSVYQLRSARTTLSLFQQQ